MVLTVFLQSRWMLLFAQDLMEESEPAPRGVDDDELLAELERDPATMAQRTSQALANMTPANLPVSQNLICSSNDDSDSSSSIGSGGFEIVSLAFPWHFWHRAKRCPPYCT